jgi:transporter family-2 protein
LPIPISGAPPAHCMDKALPAPVVKATSLFRIIDLSAAWAGFVSYLGGTLCMLALALAMRDSLPSTGAAAQSNWWAWTGGFFGAVYIAVSILLVPQVGTATFIALLVTGQMFFSLVCDHFGLLGVPQHTTDIPRLLGAVLLVGGVALIRL